MRKFSKKKNAVHNKKLQNLLSFVLLSVLFACMAHMLFLLGKGGSKPVSYVNNSFVIDNNPETEELFGISSNFILVPNISADDVYYGRYQFNDYAGMTHMDNLSVSGRFGWNDPGSGRWHYIGDDEITWETNESGNLFCIYLLRLEFTTVPEDPYYLSLPEAVGKYVIFCNGRIVENQNQESRKIFDYTGGYNSYSIKPDTNGIARIIIAMESNPQVPDPGLNSKVLLSSYDRGMRVTTMKTIWLSVQEILLILYIIGGMVLLNTFTYKRNYFLILALQACALVFNFIDNRYFTLSDISRFRSLVYLFLLIGLLSYIIVASIEAGYTHDKENPVRKRFLKWDILIPITFINLFLMVRFLVNNRYNPIIILITEAAYAIIISLINLIRILHMKAPANQYNICIVSTITSMFCVYYMLDSSVTLFSVRIYTFYIIVSFMSFLLYSLFEYVRQNNQIKNTSEILKIKVREKTAFITEMNKNLIEVNKELLENEEARKNVLSNVSHDLRTPITAIRGYTELLLNAHKNMTDEQINTYLNNIHRRSVQMERIVSDIVELTRMESNKNEFNFTTVSLSELLDEIYMMYSGDLKGTDKHLYLELPEDDFLCVKADSKKISRVFENLVSNSINYSFDSATIHIKAWREGASLPPEKQQIHVTVQDNGIGIPQEEIDRVFDRFYRAKNSGQNIKGTGLGLSIVKTIIDHHDAEISVSSILNTGTEFHIIMKAAEEE